MKETQGAQSLHARLVCHSPSTSTGHQPQITSNPVLLGFYGGIVM